MKRSHRIAFVFPLVLACAGAQAQIFVCKDASGRTLTSDRPIPECADRVVRELDKRGNTKREILPPMSAEEKRQLQLKEDKRKADEAAADEQRRNDRLIRTRYRSESDIDAARKRTVAPTEERLQRDRKELAAAEKQQQQIQIEVDALKKKSAAVPAGLQRKLDDSVLAAADARTRVQEHEAEVVQVNARFDATLKRYRELTGTTAAK